ncbi:iron-sulfur cluster carrier protein ApbC [Derxia gummosa]|uniref:Iron-sulfur cluster carrier protein n=1 Tax=Derxia gummosa DSM 723 TaxID=1121388 RepID=A0A8B6X1C7_9BURK|nr:iron-sulfur cluster carrier protein ApbC [Derxia gummosa]
MTISQESAQAALAGVVDPNTGRDLVAGKSVRKLLVQGGGVTVDIELGYPAKSQIEPIRAAATAALVAAGAVAPVVNVTQKIVAHAVQRGVKTMANVRNIIAVSSAKGGVGKSTTSANLALALAAEGARVGLLDADIYGPSQPTMFALSGKPVSEDGATMKPMENYGVQVNSIGFLIDPGQAVVWRGPLVVQALTQLLEQTAWDDLDYLVIDMPPGTGDIHLSMAQKVPLTGAVIVTTPQDIALIDTRRGVDMFDKVGIPVLGVVENMAVHVCSNCGHTEHIFGSGGGERIAKELGVELLGALPLAMDIRLNADAGKPTVVASPDSEATNLYKAIARKVAVKVADKAKDYSGKLPGIVVSSNT